MVCSPESMQLAAYQIPIAESVSLVKGSILHNYLIYVVLEPKPNPIQERETSSCTHARHRAALLEGYRSTSEQSAPDYSELLTPPNKSWGSSPPRGTMGSGGGR